MIYLGIALTAVCCLVAMAILLVPVANRLNRIIRGPRR